ncbi:enoyl-CoA hydratase [Intrasporangium oryzae NRRL B-24470]|uniref:Enoyl-CoA hydratase n=1 Tax=Intrasporangium oryzae NRRL B-24470 TaxID=1386089 RepID=W9G7U9_9MICO|nr:GNAT family N-acetyltransferase [Intrasporangium oryzae]EWT02271.1 enoyl-CoA hydratase [Intrasporangium oryzae NRRL B-24470]
MTESTWTIAPLTLADCDELGRVHVRVRREAYAGIMPADHLAGLSANRSADHWRTVAAGAADGSTAASTTLVARDAAGRVVGFASAGPSCDDDAPTQWELYVVNLLADVHGTGLADELLGRVLGDRDATLWVVEENARARAFYARHGFVLEGARSQHDATGAAEVRMVRRS